MRILCIEDDRKVTDGIKTLCELQGIDCDVCNNGMDGALVASNRNHDIIVLDIMLPGKNGFQILKELKDLNIKAPIIVLSARSSTEDKIRSFDLGADDYLVKPFSATEFFARVRRLARKKDQEDDNDTLRFCDLVYSPYKNSIIIDDNEIKLTQKEARILEILMRNPDKILDRDQIIKKVWGHQADINENNLEIYIHKLRKKIQNSKVAINTIRKMGYILEQKS